MKTIEWIFGIFPHHPLLTATCAALFITILFAFWPMRKTTSFAGMLAVFLKTFFIVVLPMSFFLLSAFLQPEWKGDCNLGWFDCWQGGKLALLPLALWAIAALYRHDLFQKRATTPKWILYGLTWGSLISGASLFHGIYFLLRKFDFHEADFWFMAFLNIPAGVFAWYTYRAVQAWRNVAVGAREFLWHMFGGGAFWIGSIYAAQKYYNHLPNDPPGCFIVTSASRGHVAIVGSPFQVQIGGLPRIANRQLQHFWEFDSLFYLSCSLISCRA
jgi:hypothetical protein